MYFGVIKNPNTIMESLLPKITKYFPEYSKSSLNNVLLLTLCLLRGGTVNLYKLRRQLPALTGRPNLKACSAYKQLIRVFDKHAEGSLWLDLLSYVFRLLRLKSDYLILDGTSWKWKGVERHYLTLCIEYGSVAVPIYWVDLGRLGASSTAERKELFEKVLARFRLEGKILLADREYIGTEWFKFLVDSGLGFVIRLRHKDYRKHVDAAGGRSYEEMCRKVRRSKVPGKSVKKAIRIEGQEYVFTVSKIEKPGAKEDLMFLLSTFHDYASAIAARYRRRWAIECCFQHLKSNGFDLEKINLEGKKRPRLLMAVTVFAYVLSIHEGLKTYDSVRVERRAGGSVYKTVSLFRHGYDNLLGKVASILQFYSYIAKEIRLATKAYKSAKWLIV